MVLVYMLTFKMGYIDGIHVTIYSIYGSYGYDYPHLGERILTNEICVACSNLPERQPDLTTIVYK